MDLGDFLFFEVGVPEGWPLVVLGSHIPGNKAYLFFKGLGYLEGGVTNCVPVFFDMLFLS